MNKIFLTFFFGLLLSNAQAQQIDTTLARQHQEVLQKALMEQHKKNGYALKPTDLQQRVIAQCVKNPNFPPPRPKDSITYGYNSARGSRFDFNSPIIGYDVQLANTLEPAPFSLLAVSVKSYSNDILKATSTASYRTDNKVDTLVSYYEPFSSPYGDSSKTINSYDIAGRAATTDYIEYHTTGAINRMTRYSYNSAGQRMADSSWAKENGTWHLADFWQYHYNTTGQRDTAAFWIYDQNTPKLDNQSVYTYYPDGTLHTMGWHKQVSDTALYSVYDTLGYTTGIGYFTSIVSRTLYRDGSRILTNRRDRRMNFPAANGSLDSAKFYTWNPDSARWDIRTLLRYSCNNFGNPDNIHEFRFVDQVQFPERTFTFYYETYEEVLGIDRREKSGSFALYPNPFTDKLSIQCNDKTVAGSYQFRLVNTLGATVWSAQKTWQGGLFSFHLPQTLAPGVYFFQVLKSDAPVHTTRLVKE